ncbi:hypothetical protein GCM10011385_23850 [Nitratireductor aestuarii]|uniref:Uncharacterized protein n=1 Tax=Nitratireductor aestuarii TaxID=1735103 RepID=A0A916RU78_9HYPH|nr:hypothetical protein [Nitratireductor aestuarii]GGA69298.1 hypothetical protein GCM10011385_23850 [Nitratireductor aestuarii]
MWSRISKFFRDSETIFWARLQTGIGSLAMMATYTDSSLIQGILPPDILPWFLFANGLATEYLRRRRSEI